VVFLMSRALHWNVRNRFMVAFVLVAVGPLILFGGLVYSRTARALHEVEQRQITAQATGARQVLRQRMAEERVHIHDYAVWDDFYTAVRERDGAWITDNVSDWVPTNGDTNVVKVFDKAGKEVSSGGNAVTAPLWPTELVQAARRGETGVDLAGLNGHLYVLAAAPVIAQTYPSQPAGVVVFGQEVTDAVLQSVNRFTGGQGRLAVYTDGGLSAATSPSENSPSPAAGAAALAAASGRMFTEGDYASKLVSLPDKTGTAVAQLKVSVRRDAFATALGEINAITIGAFVIALLLAGGIGLVVAQTISKPLRRLAAAATAMAEGDLHQELPTQRHDEIGSLAQAFNSMSAHVAERIEGLSRKTQSLALEISNLSAFGATLAQTPDPHAELRRLADMIRAMLDADAANVFLIYDGQTTRAAFSGGPRCPVPSPAADELAAWAVLSERGLEVRDAETDDHLSALARATNQLRSFLVVPLARQEGVVGALTVGFSEPHEFGPEELPLLTTIGGQIAIALQNAEAYEKLDRMYLETVTALAAAMEAKDQYTASHADSLAAMAVAVGSRLGLSDAELRMLQYAAVLHDIGKIGIPGNILNKPEALTRDEFETMAQHTIIGERIISRIDYLVPIARIIRSAHERWDGTGYPDGFKGDEIPLASRILLVCDAFDAMTTDRPYRAALPVDQAMRELAGHAGSQFDPRVVDVFLAGYPFEPREAGRHAGLFGDYAGVVELN
jgi:HD-GYP domain-containing protein (c-di-GMP phosphodiesterase class II)/HAMP domain-containing protein/sensor domain CHASE-containing protein